MLDLAPYSAALAGVSALCAVTWAYLRPQALLRCLLAVIAVWCVGYAYGDLTGDYTHWQANILFDGLAAVMILRHPAGKMQAALGGTYAVQVTMHSSYGARALWGVPDPVAYYEMLTIVAYAQLAILGVWAGGIWGRAAFDRWRHRAGAVDRGPRYPGMGAHG